jgi:hypothetical protein
MPQQASPPAAQEPVAFAAAPLAEAHVLDRDVLDRSVLDPEILEPLPPPRPFAGPDLLGEPGLPDPPLAPPHPLGPPPDPRLDPPTENGLPQRVRQASLAPQLRRSAPAPAPVGAAAPRSPEAARSVMSSFQRGWRRGLSEGQADRGHGQEQQPHGESQ